MRRALPVAWLLAAIASACAMPATGPPPPGVELSEARSRAVLAADAARRVAQVTGSPEILDQMLDDALVYVHSDGRAENKEAFIASLVGGAVDYLEIRPERTATFECRGLPVDPGPCVVREQTLVVVHGGERHTVRNCATALYRAGALLYYASQPLPASGRCEWP